MTDFFLIETTEMSKYNEISYTNISLWPKVLRNKYLNFKKRFKEAGIFSIDRTK